MTRKVVKDFEDLKQFIGEYSLNTSLSSPDFITSLKAFHKAYFAFLNLVTQLEHQNIWPSEVSNRLRESCSDIGQALFLMCHGAYKPANLILRSSIENYAKGLGFYVDPSILTMKSLYDVFNVAKGFQGCAGVDFSQLMGSLHIDYGDLCEYTHTATINEMAHISALNVLPQFDLNKANSLSSIATRVLKNYVIIILFSFKKDFFRIDPDNRDSILCSLSATLNRQLHSS